MRDPKQPTPQPPPQTPAKIHSPAVPMILGIVPTQNPASIAVHDAIAQYGRASVAGDDTVAAIRALEAVAAALPEVDPQEHPHAAAWRTFTQRELPSWAAVVNAHRGLSDDRPGVGRHVLDLRVAQQVLDAGASRATLAVWERLHAVAFGRLFGFSEPDRRGLLVGQVVGKRRQIGPHSFVGLLRFQRQKIIAGLLGNRRPDRAVADLTLAAEVIIVADRVIRRRWEKTGRVSELMDHALRGRLDNTPAAVTEQLLRDLVRGQIKIIEVDPRTGKRKALYRSRFVSVDHPRFDDDTATAFDNIPDPGADTAARQVEDRAYIEAALRLATPKQAERLEQMITVNRGWPGPRKPTARDLARAMTVAAGRHISESYVKKLKRIGRVSFRASSPR